MIYELIDYISRAWTKLVVSPITKQAMGTCGQHVTIAKRLDVYGIAHIHCGDFISIGANCTFMCKNADIIIGDHVMIGPRVTMITGNHRIDLRGRFMDSINDNEKRPIDDQPITLQGDNWIGANATILKGVTIEVGAVVAAGAIVTDNVPAYSIVGGVPAKVLRDRFCENEVSEG